MATPTNEIWKEFSTPLKRFILKRVQNEDDVEDILQEVFLKVHRSIHQLKDEYKLQRWVYQITRNTIIDYYRHRKFMPRVSDLPENLTDESIKSGIHEEVLSCLNPMIDDLPKKYKQAIILTDINGMTQKELAEKLGLSLSGAKSRVQRARERLKKMLLGCCHFEFDRRGNILNYQPKEQNCLYCTRE